MAGKKKVTFIHVSKIFTLYVLFLRKLRGDVPSEVNVNPGK